MGTSEGPSAARTRYQAGPDRAVWSRLTAITFPAALRIVTRYLPCFGTGGVNDSSTRRYVYTCSFDSSSLTSISAPRSVLTLARRQAERGRPLSVCFTTIGQPSPGPAPGWLGSTHRGQTETVICCVARSSSMIPYPGERWFTIFGSTSTAAGLNTACTVTLFPKPSRYSPVFRGFAGLGVLPGSGGYQRRGKRFETAGTQMAHDASFQSSTPY